MININSFSSKHFRLEQLAEGVYAAINSDTGWAICNAGIIDLGDRTLVFDAFLSPDAARDLNDAAECLTGRPVRAVINSHYHNDHIWGNQAFSAELDIISTAKTRDLITTEGLLEVQGYSDVAQKRLETLEAQLVETHDETKLFTLKLQITEYQAIIALLPKLQIRLPNLTFTGNMAFNGPKRSAKLISYEGGHCGSDAILYLPEDGIVFMEDLLFIGFHPYLADGDPGKIQHILAQVRKLQAKIYVPGHGPVGQIAHLDWMDEYINTLNTLVREAIKSGATEAEMDNIAVPGKYQHLPYATFYPVNLKFIYRQQLTLVAGIDKKG
jgi:glyoxylase-like metal-dependent hydrolase (beta-lactamase superfamily II)